MLWLHGEPSLTNAASLSVSEWGSLHSLLLGSGFTISWLGVSERGILELHHFGSILLSHLFSWFGVVPKYVEWWGLVGAAAVCITGTGTSRRCGILTPLDMKWAYVASNLWTSSPCLNCMGWQDTSLTVAKEDRASSPYLNCIGWQDKSSSGWSFPMSGGMASSPYLNCVGWQDKLTVEVMNHNALWTASAPLECYRTDLVLVLLRHGHLVDRIEENQKIVIVGVRLVSKFLPTMTLYCTIILEYCRVQLKKKSRVGACWSRRFFTTFDMCRLITSA